MGGIALGSSKTFSSSSAFSGKIFPSDLALANIFFYSYILLNSSTHVFMLTFSSFERILNIFTSYSSSCPLSLFGNSSS